MNKTLYLFTLFLGFFSTIKSQHCGWDSSYIIMLDVRDQSSNEIINDLDIRLADSIGNPYVSSWNSENNKEISIYQKTDTLKFGQNRRTNSPKQGIYEIPFGVNTYMLLVYYNNYPGFNKKGSDKIIIKDNKGRYETISITFDNDKIASMCTNTAIWADKESADKITVKLNKKK